MNSLPLSIKINKYITKWDSLINRILATKLILNKKTQYLYYLENYIRKGKISSEDWTSWTVNMLYWARDNYLRDLNKGGEIKPDGFKQIDFTLEADDEPSIWEELKAAEKERLKLARHNELVKALNNLGLPKKINHMFELIIFEGFSMNQALKQGGNKETYYKYYPKVIEALKPVYEKYSELLKG